MTTTRRLLLSAPALALALAACGGDDDSAGTTVAVTTTEASSAGDAATTAPSTVAATTAPPTTEAEPTTVPATTAPPTTEPEPTTVPFTVAPENREESSGSLAAGEVARVEVALADGETMRFRVSPRGDAADLVVTVVWDERALYTGVLDHPAFLDSLGLELSDDPTVDELIAAFEAEEFWTDPSNYFSDPANDPMRDGEIVVERIDYSSEGSPEATFEIGIGPGPMFLLISEYGGNPVDYDLVIERGPSLDIDDLASLDGLESDPFFSDEAFYGS